MGASYVKIGLTASLRLIPDENFVAWRTTRTQPTHDVQIFCLCVWDEIFFQIFPAYYFFFNRLSLPASLNEETNNMPYSQWNRQPDKADLFSWHSSIRFFFLLFLLSGGCWMQLFLALTFAAECSFDYYLYSFSSIHWGMFIDCFSFRDWCFVACLRSLPWDIERHQGGVCMCGCLGLCVGTNWRLMNASSIVERKEERLCPGAYW